MIIRLVKRSKPNIKVKVRLIKEIGERKEKIPTLEELITFYKIGVAQNMARPDFTQTLTEFAEFVGMKDKEIIALIGALSTLTTTQKGSIVGAINELKQSITALSSSSAGINDSATGDSSTFSAKKILELLTQAKADVKNELLGGEVDASIDTIKELGELLKNVQTGEDGLNKLVQKVTQTNQSLALLVGKFTVLDGLNLKEAYNRGYNK